NAARLVISAPDRQLVVIDTRYSYGYIRRHGTRIEQNTVAIAVGRGHAEGDAVGIIAVRGIGEANYVYRRLGQRLSNGNQTKGQGTHEGNSLLHNSRCRCQDSLLERSKKQAQ